MTINQCCQLQHPPYQLPVILQLTTTALACSQNWTRAGYALILMFGFVLTITSKAAASETDLTQEEELTVLKEQHALLSRLLHQQNEVS